MVQAFFDGDSPVSARIAALLHQGETYKAIRELRSVEIQGATPATLKSLGIAYYAAGQHVLFRRKMFEAIDANPLDYAPHYYLGRHYFDDVQDYAKAAEYFRKAIQRNPNYARSYYFLGHSLERAGQPAESQLHFEKALQLDSCNAPAHAALARLGHNPELSIQRAMACDPNDPNIHRDAARIQPESAIRHLTRAVELDPLDAPTLYRLHRALAAAGRSAEASRVLDRYREMQAVYGGNN